MKFIAGPLDGWTSEQCHDRPVTLPEALHATGGIYVLEMWSGGGKVNLSHIYRYRWHEGELP